LQAVKDKDEALIQADTTVRPWNSTEG